jgi:hypothetical protein
MFNIEYRDRDAKPFASTISTLEEAQGPIEDMLESMQEVWIIGLHDEPLRDEIIVDLKNWFAKIGSNMGMTLFIQTTRYGVGARTELED